MMAPTEHTKKLSLNETTKKAVGYGGIVVSIVFTAYYIKQRAFFKSKKCPNYLFACVCVCVFFNNFPNVHKYISVSRKYRSISRSNLILGKVSIVVEKYQVRAQVKDGDNTQQENHSVSRSRSNNACSLYWIHSDTIFLSGLLVSSDAQMSRKKTTFCTLPIRSPSPKQK